MFRRFLEEAQPLKSSEAEVNAAKIAFAKLAKLAETIEDRLKNENKDSLKKEFETVKTEWQTAYKLNVKKPLLEKLVKDLKEITKELQKTPAAERFENPECLKTAAQALTQPATVIKEYEVLVAKIEQKINPQLTYAGFKGTAVPAPSPSQPKIPATTAKSTVAPQGP